MWDFIPSKSVREYMNRSGFTCSDRDLASMLYQSAPPLAELHRLLAQLAQRTTDGDLRREIEERLAYDRCAVERFSANDGRFLYLLLRGENSETAGYFTRAEAAQEAGKAENLPFAIQKHLFRDAASPDEPSSAHGPLATFHYETGGTLQDFWSCELPQEQTARLCSAQRFEERFAALPNPFQRGDIVRLVDCPDPLGVVETSREEWDKLVADARTGRRDLDCFDATLQVELLYSDGAFGHDHISPLRLEWVTEEPDKAQKTLLEVASGLLTGRTSLDFFLEEYRDYCKNL